MYLKSLMPLDHLTYSELYRPNSYQKRDSLVQSTTINTTSFILNFECYPPYGDNTFSKCEQARESIRIGLIELEKYIFLPNPVTIRATFQSFCAIKTSPGSICNSSSQVLGRAAPAQMIILDPTAASDLGLDSNYGYPSSLIRQYAPSEMENVTTDIAANFNSDYNWLLSPEPIDPNWGPSVVIQGGFFNASSRNTVIKKLNESEIIHGLGFLSSWGVYFPKTFPNTFFPSFLDYDESGDLRGVSTQWIYDKLLSDTLHGVWISSYSKAIGNSVIQALRKGGQSSWVAEFKNTSGYQIGQSLTGLFSTPKALGIWYLEKGRSKSLKHAVISSPNPFAPGSSISHLDSTIYNSVASYLMRPSATSGVKLERLNPGSGNPFGGALLGIMRSMGYVVRQ